MEKKGLCMNCVQSVACIFPKQPLVWQCEEFSNSNHAPIISKRIKAKRISPYEAETEKE